MKPHLLRCLICGLALAAGCNPEPREATVAVVDGGAILHGEVGIELRSLLWRRGEAWSDLDSTTRSQRRQEALDRCIERRLLQSFSAAQDSAPHAQATEDAFQQFLKQFGLPDGWTPRLQGQGLTEAQMRERISREVTQLAAIEEWLKSPQSGVAEVTEDAARAWYDQHREEFRLPDRAKVSQIFLSGHDKEKPDRAAEIQELHRKLLAGEASLETLASRFSEDERSNKVGGSLGWIGRDRVPGDFATQVFTVPLGVPSAPFRTGLGWHIGVVHERRPARAAAFPEVKDEIIAHRDRARREAAVPRLLQELRKKSQIDIQQDTLATVDPAPQGG